ncbi:outer membrane porin GjpA [Gordonia sputi]
MQRSAPIALQGDIEVPRKVPRAWVAAGVAIAGASVMAVAPGVHSEVPTAYKATTEATVRLAADWKPLEPYIDAFNEASKNAATLAHNYFLAPGLPLQQIIANQSKYLNDVLNDPSQADDVLKKMRANLEAVISGVTGIGVAGNALDTMKNHSVDGLHGLVLGLLPSLLPAGGSIDPEVITAVMNVLASPMSGVLMGLVGPVISPAVAVLNSGIAIAAAIQAGNPDAVFSDVFSAPANVVGAVFNGATLDLTALTPLINDSGLLGTTKLNSLDIAFGGLFTPGTVGRGSYDGPDNPDNPDNKIPAPGGSIFNSIGLGVDLNGIEIGIPGQAIGPIGALEGVSQTVGALLGDGWDGKSGKPVPPLAGVEFPTISDDAADNWAAAIQKLADTLLGKKDSETTTPSPDPAKTAAAVAVTSVAPNSVDSAKVDAEKVDSAKVDAEKAQSEKTAPVTTESAQAEVVETQSSSAPTGSSSEVQNSSEAKEFTLSSSSTAPASSSTGSSSDSTQSSTSSGSSTSNSGTDAHTTSSANTTGSADAESSSSSDTSSTSGDSSGASSTSGNSTSSANTD